MSETVKQRVTIRRQKEHFTIKFAVCINGTSIAYCDTKERAEMVKAALDLLIKETQ